MPRPRQPLPLGRPAAGQLPYSGGSSTPCSFTRSPWASAPIGCGASSTARPCCCSSFPCSSRPSSSFTCTPPTAAFPPTPSTTACSAPSSRRRSYDTMLKKIPLQARWETLLDYFFDQRDGLLLYNPFYFFAFPGLLLALKNFRRYRLHLLAALPAVLFILNHAFSTIRAGYCPQGRYLAPAAWALLLFALVYYRESRNRFFRRAVPRSAPVPAFRHRLPGAGSPSPSTSPPPTIPCMRAGLHVPELEQQPHRPAGAAPLLSSRSTTAATCPMRCSWRSSCCWSCWPWPLAPASPASRARRASLPTLVFLGIFSLASLFPRLDRAEVRLFTGPRDLPVRVYFEPGPAHGSEPASWSRHGRELPPAHRDPGAAERPSRSAWRTAPAAKRCQ